MADVAKKIWFQLQRKDIEDAPPSEAYSVEIQEGQEGHTIKEHILQTCKLCNVADIILKLRNHRGSIIPITENISSNSVTRPYVLEVVSTHQNIKAQPRSVKIKSYNETMKEKLLDIITRIAKLEAASPELNERRNASIDKEMKELEQMLKFLTKRIEDAEQTNWKGMFKKNPLW